MKGVYSTKLESYSQKRQIRLFDTPFGGVIENVRILTARSSYASAVLGIVILSVCPSVTRVLCDEIKKHTADILIPHKRIIILVFLYQQRLVGDAPFHL